MIHFSQDLLQFTRNSLLTFILVGFFLCGVEKSAILCSSLKCSSVANWVLWNGSLSRKSNCDNLKKKITLNMCTKVFQIRLNWALFFWAALQGWNEHCMQGDLWNKKGWCSGAHFQIITQKGKRKVKLIQRQRKKNTKIRNKIHAKASSHLVWGCDDRLTCATFTLFCYSTICISWDYAAMIDTWYFLGESKSHSSK